MLAGELVADRTRVLTGGGLAVGRDGVLEVERDTVGRGARHLAQDVGLARGREEEAAEAGRCLVHDGFRCCHQRVPAGATHELVALVVAAMFERDDALPGA